MAKVLDYYCKDCGHNNNGWCPIKKMNGLKKIQASDCNKKILEIVTPDEEDDILDIANKEVSKNEMFNKKDLAKYLKENISIEIDTKAGDDPGTTYVYLKLVFDDYVIADSDFII